MYCHVFDMYYSESAHQKTSGYRHTPFRPLSWHTQLAPQTTNPTSPRNQHITHSLPISYTHPRPIKQIPSQLTNPPPQRNNALARRTTCMRFRLGGRFGFSGLVALDWLRLRYHLLVCRGLLRGGGCGMVLPVLRCWCGLWVIRVGGY